MLSTECHPAGHPCNDVSATLGSPDTQKSEDRMNLDQMNTSKALLGTTTVDMLMKVHEDAL